MLELCILICIEVVLKIIGIILSKLYICETKKKRAYVILSNSIIAIIGLFVFSMDYLSYIRFININMLSYVFCFSFFFYTFKGLLRTVLVFFTDNECPYYSNNILKIGYEVSKIILENFIILVPMQFFFIENDLYVLLFIFLFSILTYYLDSIYFGIRKIEEIILSGLKSVFLFFILIGTYNFFIFLLYIVLLYLYDEFFKTGESK